MNAAFCLRPVRSLFPGLFILILVALSVPSAWAHARLTHSLPRDKSELKEAPGKIEFWFNELLDEGFNYVEVFPAAEANRKKRTNFVQGEPVVDKDDRTHLIARLKKLPPGQYVVEYRVLSRDGHTAPGRVKFNVVAPE